MIQLRHQGQGARYRLRPGAPDERRLFHQQEMSPEGAILCFRLHLLLQGDVLHFNAASLGFSILDIRL